ncbi:isopeptide-forming domain-containing fimbrial protein [Streptococcus oralis]|uniref:isopeptide-forming domain-containing fimbrial protein n=1 Tax=Streptococcus oralis TaxID=1303 RepID=UPI002283DDEC|nr:isopeptide-forming domain-containing fimbrial protein [Streptococcus oralis]MCY7082453.1 isopeptide-forming domain-containing fimbrial protein [Streptococcus oralis]
MRDFIKKVSILFIILFLSVPLALMGQLLGSAAANEGGSTIEVGGNTKITQNGCSRKIEKTEKISWRLPRKPVDLVILQDASGSFKNTIPNVQNALKTLTTFVREEEYDENNPRLVKTNNPDTSDRVMMATFQGADGYNYYYNNDFTGRKDVYGSWGPDYDYKYKASNLSSNQNDIHQFIDNIKVAGGTPTVPAIDDVIAQYNQRKGNMANGRKTIFLLITDGVANGKRDPDGKVRLEYSDYRNNILTRAWNFNELTEASQNVLGRVKEVKEASTRLKNVVGSEGTVVVGFWEDVSIFANSKAQYYDTYKEGYSKYFDIGDNRSVQEIFHEALEGMASPAKNINGKDVSFYVNEQSDINKFSSRVLESVGAALVKEDIKGEFEVTPGYKVDAVRINGKKIVSKVTDSKKEIRGKIVQEGDKVTISVPESVFNPGNNKFDYDLSKEAHAEQVDEDDEQDPPADYKPVKETVPVPELTGKFKVGDFATETIGGSKETVEVQKLEYCYPSATKKIADQDQSNDTGTIEDPLQLTKKPSYAANLSAKDETFTYTVDYNFNNAPYEFKKNVMLTDPLDYRLEVVGHHASGPQGQILTRVVKQNDDLGNERDVVVADVPSVNGYEYLVLQKAKMTITVRLKEQYRNNQASKEFMALLQDNDGFGLLNQGNIMWNGEDNNPDPSKHAKTADKPSTIRRSNPVYVKPPVDTEITKKVNNKEHEDLKTEEELFEYKVTVPWPGIADTFSLTDTVVSELEVQADSLNVKLGEKDNTELKTATKVEGQTVSLTLDKTQLEKISRKVTRRKTKDVQYLELTFKAKIRPGADLSKYKKDGQVKVPNTADIALNDIKKTSNEVTVTPPKPKEPTIDKKINENLDSFQTFDGQPYNYNITTAVPSDVANYKKFVIRDTLDANLELAGAVSIKGSAAALFDIHTNGQEITATVKDGQFGELAKYSTVELVIPAKVKNGVTGTTIENKASISFTNENNVEKEVESKPVTVTPPTPDEPEIKKDVNGKEAETLDKRDQVFTYNVKTTVAQDATAFSVTDKIEDVLEFAGKSSAKLNGQALDDSQIKVEGQTITLTLTEDQVKANGGQAVELTFDAKIKAGANLSAYVKEDGRTQIPNKASYDASFPHKPGVHKDSNEVPVTPPTPDEPEIKKDVNGKEAETLDKRDQVFTYNVKTTVAQDATAFAVTDTLVDVLEFAGTSSATLNGQALDASQIKVEGQTITLTLTEEQVKANGGQAVELTFDAKIKAGANLSAYVKEDGRTQIPNKASYDASFPHKPGVHKDSNEVPVTPPTPEEPEIKKDVNGKESETLDKRDQVFTYNVKTTVAQDATAFSVTDKIEDVLEFAGTSSAKLNGQALDASQIKVEGQTITLILTEEQVKANGGQAVELTFDAKIKAGANLSAYVKEDGRTQIPNKASYDASFPHKPGVHKDSNEVPVTPPTPEEPEIKKDVNGKAEETLAKRDQVFTYNVKTTVAQDATAFSVTDTLVDVLEFAGTSSAKLNGQALEASQIKVDGQTITLTLTEEQVKANGGQAVELTFDAKIKAGANLSAYLSEDKTVKVPNKAAYKADLPNKPGFTKDSNEVPVTPPTPEEPEIKKDVNGKEAETLDKRDQVFTYNVKTTVAQDATAFSVTDTLVDVLEFAGTSSAKLNGQALDASQIKVEGQTITLTLTEEQVKANGGQAVELTFDAKIKAGANLSAYLSEDKTVKVPNKAAYKADLPNKPGFTKDSNEVPVTPPTPEEPEIKKDVNTKAEETLADRDQVFTYNVKTSVPTDATAFSVSDTLESVLDYAGSVKASLNGQALDVNQIKVEGQTITLTLTEEQVKANGGQAVELSFTAKIKAGADLTPYLTDRGFTVPNTASYDANIPNKPGLHKDSNKVPVIVPKEPEPEISKKINRTLDHLDVEYDAPYMYNVNTTLPKDIDKYKEFTVTDTLESVLAIADTPVAYVDGRNANGALETSVEGNTVTVKVKDFARLKGFKEIQLYIPAKLKANSDLKAYKDQLVPNRATVNFKDANGQSGNKETKPVTVKPRDPEKPTDPTPGEPAKSVGPEDGSKPDKDYHLPNALDTFRFDITTPVPTDPVDENGNAKKDQYGRLIKTDLTSFTITDKIDSVLKVNKDRIALKVENAQFDKIKATLQAQLEQSEKELKALTGKSTEETSTETGKKEELKAAEAKVAELKAKLEAAKAAQPAKPAETTTPATPATAAEETTPATSDSSATEDKKPATSELSQDLASLEAELKAAEENLAKLQAPAQKESELAPADKKQQQEKLENEIKKLKEAQTKLQAAIDKLSKVSNDRGELVGKDLEAIATVTYDETSNVVTFEISDKDVLEALKGSTVRLVLYTNFKEGTDFTKFTGGVPNTAEVSFNHNPKPKTTNKVVVFPPTPPTPEKPQTPPPGGTVPPAEPKKTLPNTGSEASSIFGVLAALALGLAGLLVWKRKAER